MIWTILPTCTSSITVITCVEPYGLDKAELVAWVEPYGLEEPRLIACVEPYGPEKAGEHTEGENAGFR